MATKFELRPFFWSSPNFGQKIGLNLSEDLLFFGLHLILGKILPKFSEFSALPPFQNPAYATNWGGYIPSGFGTPPVR